MTRPTGVQRVGLTDSQLLLPAREREYWGFARAGQPAAAAVGQDGGARTTRDVWGIPVRGIFERDHLGKCPMLARELARPDPPASPLSTGVLPPRGRANNTSNATENKI